MAIIFTMVLREHAMSGIMNGLALHSNLIPYGGTFLIFSDYCKPSIRLSSNDETKSNLCYDT